MSNNSPYVQPRLVSSAFDTEKVHVLAWKGREAISQLFELELRIVELGDGALDIETISGARASLELCDHEGTVQRTIHGMVAWVEEDLDPLAEQRCFVLKLVPRAWRTTLVKTQEIYLDMSVPEIIEEKLKRVGLSGTLSKSLLAVYPTRDFVVQYRETDRDFIGRLSEHLGISFYFDHAGDEDRVVFCDHFGGFGEIANPDVPLRDRDERRDIFALRLERRLVPKHYVVYDYNYRRPDIELTASAELSDGYGGGVAEYAGHFRTPSEGQELIASRLQAAQCNVRMFSGQSDVARLEVGKKLRLSGHPRLEERELLLTELVHEGYHPLAGAGRSTANSEPASYHNHFRAVPAEVMYRPPIVSPKPRIAGVLTGLVEPNESRLGKLAKLDEAGRYTVKFLFDTAPLGQQQASHPVRRAQPLAGLDEGMHFPLKPGVEVALAFADGDPDRPIILGALPNTITPSVVGSRDAQVNRIVTHQGIRIQFGRARRSS